MNFQVPLATETLPSFLELACTPMAEITFLGQKMKFRFVVYHEVSHYLNIFDISTCSDHVYKDYIHDYII